MAIKAIRPIPTELASCLLGIYRGATSAEDISAGLAWYTDARTFAATLAQRFDISLETACTVIAALSPQLEWGKNMQAAEKLLSGEKPGAVLGASVAKARAILADGATLPDAYYKHAPKVCAFARNIRGMHNFVTVDTHAAEAAHNDASRIPNVSRDYALYSEAYQLAAAEVGMAPAAFQAVIWTTWKRIHTPESKRSLRRKVSAPKVQGA